MTPTVFLLLNLVLAFYNVGTIWAHEVDIFRTWKLINPEDFPKVQTAHWRKLPYWIFTPVGLALCGGVALVWYHPTSSPVWAIWANLICQALAIVLTAILWGQWQAKLSNDRLAPGVCTSRRFLRRIGCGRCSSMLMPSSSLRGQCRSWSNRVILPR